MITSLISSAQLKQILKFLFSNIPFEISPFFPLVGLNKQSKMKWMTQKLYAVSTWFWKLIYFSSHRIFYCLKSDLLNKNVSDLCCCCCCRCCWWIVVVVNENVGYLLGIAATVRLEIIDINWKFVFLIAAQIWVAHKIQRIFVMSWTWCNKVQFNLCFLLQC